MHYLRGEYAFVLWDQLRQRVFAARDRFGIKPLFRASAGNALVFASEVKALHAMGPPEVVGRDGLFEVFTVCSTGPRTLFAGVESVPPGHYLLAENGVLTTRKYWDWNFPLNGQLLRDALASLYILTALGDRVEIGHSVEGRLPIAQKAEAPVFVASVVAETR